MSGKILIVDPLSTNRIVLKVKLSAAYYDVTQGMTGREAVEIAQRDRPDLILISAALEDMDYRSFIKALRKAVGPTAPSVVLILPENDRAARLDALQAGAADVLSKPFEETLLLARLRSLLRQRHSEIDLGLRPETAEALGFAEEPAVFVGPDRIAIVDGCPVRANKLRHRLSGLCPHDIVALTEDLPGSLLRLTRQPDVILMRLDDAFAEDGLRLMAELRTAPQTRHARIVALLDTGTVSLAAPILDIGASDSVTLDDISEDELMLRLTRQLTQKKQGDHIRYTLESGLQAAVIDPLTGLYNRRYALSFLKRMIAEAAGSERTFAVMVADLDHFKTVNDTHGHSAGDTVLARIAGRMRSKLPPDAMVARLGGEEFLIALPDTTRADARRTADHLCRLVRETPVSLPGGGGPVQVTVSIGATLGTPENDTARLSVDSLIDQADRALYGSKSGGRDTVTFCARTAA